MCQSLFDYDNCNQYNIDFGQGFRDYQKIKRLVELGYTVYTIDDKHDSIPELHCRTNFNMYRDFYKCIRKVFPSITLGIVQFILIDYFFSPVSYNNQFLSLLANYILSIILHNFIGWLAKIFFK